MANFTLTANADDFTATLGEDNVFSGLTVNLSSDDTLTGQQIPVFQDRLVLSGGGLVTAEDLSGVTSMERIDLLDGTDITLVDAFVSTSAASRFEIRTSDGTDLINASELTGASGNMRLVLSAGNTTYLAGSNNIRIDFGAGDLTANDIFVGGSGVNTLSANEAVFLSAQDIANFSQIKSLTFREGGSIALIDGFGRDGTTRVVSRSDENIVVDGSAIVEDKLRLTAGGGDDILIGGALRDRFYFDIDEGELDSNDIVNGGGGFDFLILSGTGAVTADDLAGVTNIPIIQLAAGNISIELTDALTDRNSIAIEARNGMKTVDASDLVETAVSVEFRTGTSTFLGSSLNDQVITTATRLGEEDTFDGGAGSDELVITTFSRISAEELVNVTNFEELTFTQGSIFTLTDGFTTGDSLRINLSDGVEEIDGTFETTAEILFAGVDAGDDLTGGGASDTFVLKSGDFIRIDGGGGDFNRIVLGETLSDVDLTDPVAQDILDSIQVVELSAAAGRLTVNEAAVSEIAGPGQELFVIGQAADLVDIIGNWTAAGTRSVPALSATPFDVYTSSTGQTLLVLQGVQATIAAGEAPTDLDLSNTSIAENDAGGIVGAITVTDPTIDDTHTFTVDDERFEVVSGNLQLKAGIALDYEVEDSVDVLVTATDAEGASYSETFTISVTDVNEAPTVALTQTVTDVDENTDVSAGLKVADITVSDDALGTNDLSLSGADAARFEIRGTELYFVGSAPDFEAQAQYDVSVDVDDAAVGGSPDDSAALSLAINDVNEAPTVALTQTVTDVDENTDVSAGLKVADITVSDDALGTNDLSLSGADAARFEIRGTELYFVGSAPDFEAQAQYDVSVDVDDAAVGGTPDDSATLSLAINDVNEAPTVALTQTVTDVDENTDVSAGLKVADITVSDDALGTNDLSLSGADAARFEIRGTELYFVGSAPDFEAQAQYDVSVDVDDTAVGVTPDDSATLSLAINDVNEAPTVVLTQTVTDVDENTDVSAGLKVADITVSDDALGTNDLSLSGADAARFEIRGSELYFVGSAPDFEAQAQYDVSVDVDDAAVGGTPDDSATLSLAINDVNEAPTVALTQTVTDVDENTDVSAGLKVADITVSDDALGTNDLSLSGADAARFEIRGSELYFVGDAPDFEAQAQYDVSVDVDDTAVGATPDDSATLSLAINDVNEAPTVALTQTVTDVDENTDVSAGLKVADITVSDDALGTNDLSLSGADAARFEIRGTELYFVGSAPDFEAQAQYDVSVDVDDAAVGGSPDDSAALSLAINDVNEAPTVALTQTVTDVDENTDVSAGLKVADITVSDDALGTNDLSLSGADAARFEIRGTELYFVGSAPDFEAQAQYDVSVDVDDTTVGGSPDDSATLSLAINDVNEAPTVVLTQTVTDVDENTDVSAGLKVADITVSDDALGTNDLSLSGADAARFEIRGTELYFVGSAPDFEAQAQYDVSVDVDDAAVGGSPDDSATLSLAINDVNEAPTVALTQTVTDVDENTDVSAGLKVADITVSDDALGTNDLSLSGADAARFEIRGTELYFVGSAPDFEAQAQYDVSVDVDDAAVGGTPDDSATLSLAINDVNEAPTVALTQTVTDVDENTDVSAGLKVADITVSDDALGTNDLSLSGADAARFEIRGTELYFVGSAPDFEAQAQYDVSVDVDDTTVGGSPDDSATLSLAINDVNEAPTVVLTQTVTDVDENTDVSAGLKVADITVSDDALGTNDLSLSGADAARFEIRGTELYFVGSAPDFEAQAQYDVSVDVDDTTVGGSPDDSATLSLAINDVNEAPTVVLTQTVTDVDENTDVSAGLKVADITVSDDALGTNDLSLSGADAARFEIRGTELYFVGSAPDFEAQAQYDVSVDVDDTAVGVTPDDSATLSLAINDVNEAPTVVLTQTVTDVDENTDVSAGLKVADITVSDDALGTNDLSLSGADAARFEIRGTELYFVGSAPDFEAQAQYDVSVTVDDAGIPGTPDDSAALSLTINDVNEAPTAVADTADAVEDVLVAPTGNLLVNDADVDAGQDLDIASVNGNSMVVEGDIVATGIYGDLVVDAETGDYTYTLNAITAQALAAGQVVTDTFSYVATDNGVPALTAASSLVVTVTGTNDQPIARADTAAVTEDLILSASGNVIAAGRGDNAQGVGDMTDTDIDTTDVLTVTAVNGLPGNVGDSVEGTYGNLTLEADGDYTYALGVTVEQAARVDALRQGDAPVETFTYTIRDSAGDADATTLKITVTGTNDVPTLSIDPVALTQTSGQSNVVATNAAAADPDNDILVLTVSLDVVANSNAADTALDSGDVLGFDASFRTFLESQGFTVEGGTDGDDLVITAPNGEPLGNTFAEAILEQVKYTAGDESFGFNANDRVVSVTLTDIVGASSTPVEVTIDMAADVTDTDGLNVFAGGNLADIISGGSGDDRITGGEGDDDIDGGADIDTAVYADNLSGYTVTTTADASGFVTSFNAVEDIATDMTDEGTDTLTSVEVVEFADQSLTLAKAVQLFTGTPGADNLSGTFDTIQAAIDAAGAGDTILVNGTGGPGSTVYAASESLSIDKGVTIQGLGDVSVLSIAVTGGGAGQAVDIDNLDVAAATAAVAVNIDKTATYDSVTFQNGDVTGGLQHGLFVGSSANPLTAASTVAAVIVENAGFSGNGTNPSNGAGGLTFFGYNNDITLTGVTVEGGTGTDNGIQLRGLDATAPAGTITLEGVEITGAFLKTGMAVYNYADLDGLGFAGTDPSGSLNIDVTAAFAGLNIDGVGGDVDLAAAAGLAVANATATSPDINVNAETGEVGNLLTGDASDDILSGNAGNDDLQGNAGSDILFGGAGADSLSGGAGDDAIIQFVGEGTSDEIDGGAETDAVVLLDSAATDDAVEVIYDGSSLTSLDGASLTGVETVTAHVDTTFGSGGALVDLPGDTGIDTLSYAGTTAAVTVDLEAGTATGFAANPQVTLAGAPDSAISGFENVTGGTGDDRLDGSAADNIIDGGAGVDTTAYEGTVTADQFSLTLTGWQVATTAEGTDTLEGVEQVAHAGGTIFLVGNGGYTSIQDAIDVAANGDTILVAPGTYGEDLVLDVAVNIIGISGDAADVTIGSARIGSGLAGAGMDTIEIANMTVDADQGSAATGIVYDGSYDGTDNALTGLTLENLDISGFANSGILVNGGGSGFVAAVTDVSVSDSGASGGNGSGGISFFEYLGDVAFDGVSVDGNNAVADHGIQVAGFRQSDYAIDAPIGTVTFTDTSVTGTFDKTLAFVQGYNDLAGLDFTGGLELNGTASWTGLYVNPTFGPNVTPAAAPSTIDLTGVNVTGGSYGTSPGFAQTGNAGVVVIGTGVDGTITGSDSDPNVFVGDALVGTTANETINAGAGADLIFGGGGNDTLNGGTGNDTFVTFAGDGADQIDGGSNGGVGPDSPGDTLIVSNVFPDGTLGPADGNPDASPSAAFVILEEDAANGSIDVRDITNVQTDEINEIENLRYFMGSGTTRFELRGDLASQGLTNVFVGPDDASGQGGDGSDILIAENLADGGSTVVTFQSGGGNDTFVVNNGATGYTYSAGDTGETTFFNASWGSVTGDIVDYSDFSTGVTVDLNDTGSGQSGTGFASLTGVENVIGSGFNDTFTGNDEDNVFVSQGGSDAFSGGAGNDTVDVPGNIGSFTYSVAANGTITLSNETDTLEIADDIETLRFDNTTLDLTNPVRVVDASGSLVQTYATIQAAVDAASTTDGMTVQILGQAAAFAESVNTGGKALSFEGVTINGNRAVIDPASGNGFTVAGDTGGGNVSFVNLDITGGVEGIFVDDEANVGTLTITDSNITDNDKRGLYVLGESGSQEGAAEVIITDTTFSGNSEDTTNGNSQIKLFGFSGDATFTGLTVAGSENPIAEGVEPPAVIAARPDNAIEITGNVNGGSANNGGTPPNIGTIDFVDVTVTGAYHKNPVAIFNYAELDGLTITDLDVSGAESDWGPLFNIDGVTDATIDASGYGITFPAGYGIVSEIQGEKIGQADVDTTIIGTDADDRIHGKTGDDSLEGGAGDDQLYGAEKGTSGTSAEAGNDVMIGGAGDDYLNGGADTDTGATTGEGDVARYISTTATLSSADISMVSGVDPVSGAAFEGWQVDATDLGTDQGTDTLNDVEIVETRDSEGALVSRILLVGNGGFDTIQQAVDEAQNGDTILIAEGTYAEQVVVDGLSDLSVIGLGDVTVTPPEGTLSTTSTSSSNKANNSVIDVLNGTNVTFENLLVDGAGRAADISGTGTLQFLGVNYRNASGGLTDVEVIGIRDAYPGGTAAGGEPIVSGNQRGVGVQADNDSLMSFFMDGGSISDFQKNATVFNRAALDVSGVTVTGGGAQTINAQNGIQILNSTGTVSNNILTGIGYAGTQVVYSGMILAYGNTDLFITDNTLVGSNIDDTNGKVGGIFVLDFGTPNSGGAITGNTISHVDFGIDVSGDVTPDQILIEDNTITDLDLTDPYVEGVGHFPTETLTTEFDVEGSAETDYLYGAAADDNLVGLAGDDYLDGRGGVDTVDGGLGDDYMVVDNAGDVVIEAVGEGQDTVEASVDYTLGSDAEIETLLSNGTGLSLTGNDFAQEIIGDAGENLLSGGGGADVLTGGAAADVLSGGAGADVLYGTDDEGDEANTVVDTATYAEGATIAWNDADGRWEVTADGETDQLYGIEKVTVGTETFLLVDDATGATAGGFATVTEAEAAAVDGDTILVAEGSYTGATLTKAVTVQGVGSAADETIFSSGFTVDLAAAGTTVTLRDFAMENISGTSIKAQQDTQVLDTLRIEGVRVEGGTGSGLVVSGRKQSDAYDQAGVQKVEIVNSDFIDNAQSSDNNGNIVLFEYDGDVDITDVTSSNTVTGANSAAYLVQLSGFDGPRYDQKTPAPGSSVGSYDVLTAMGAVVIDGLDVSGDARKPGLYIQGYTDLTGLSITNSTVDVVSGWSTPVIIDPMADQSPSGTPNTTSNGGSFFDETSANASYDLSGLTVVQKPGQVVVAEGTSKTETITGTAVNDYFVGFGGDDTLNGTEGDDLFIFNFGDGADVIDGGADTDTLNLTGSAAGDDMTITDAAVTLLGGGSVSFSNMESVLLNGDTGSDTFRFTDASLTGGPIYTVDGGADTDTLDFAAYDSAVTVSLIGATFRQTGAAEVHTVGTVANMAGSLFDDILTGDNLANDISGSDGDDVLVGLNGNDVLDGGAGNDELYGGNNADVIFGGAGADFLNGGGGLDTFRYTSLSEGTDGAIYDLIASFATADNDVFEIEKAGFAGLESEASGVLEAENFVNANVNELDGTYFGFTPGQATFVFDDTGTNLSGNRELWFDAEGDGTAVKMLEFNSASSLTGFDETNFILVGEDTILT